ncbi:MAG: hypothetical protein WC107_05030 [Patescibacteria group bacterium]
MEILLLKAFIFSMVGYWVIRHYFLNRKIEKNDVEQIKSDSVGNSPRQKDEYQTLIDNVEALRESIRQIKQVQIEDVGDRLSQAHTRLDTMMKLSEDLGISGAIALLSEKLRELHAQDSWEHNYPKSSEGDKIDGIDDLYYISGSNETDGKKTSIIDEFKFKENLYILTICNEDCVMPDNEMCRFTEVSLRFFDGGEYCTVFYAEAKIDDTSYDLYQMEIIRVTNIKIGNWISDIVQIHELLKAENTKSSLEWRAKLLESKIADKD